MKPLIALAVVLTVITACQPTKETKTEVKTPTLTLKWASDTTLTTCESVLYDPTADVLYVADIAGKPDSADGVGFIAKLGLDGKVIDAQWVKGLNAPKGMGLSNGKLYVADINKVVEIDPATGTVSKSYPVEGAVFLNDITTDGGKVYVSDTGTGVVSVLENGTVSPYLTGVNHANGLLVDGSTFLVAQFEEGFLSTVDGQKQLVLKADSVANADGIEAVGDGGYLVSSWNGKVTYVAADGTTTTILDTTGEKNQSAADIEYIPGKKLLLIPTFFGNKVVAYELAN
ncbi:MAG: ATP/GTP-binding protein [Bacteroidota bacterium]